MSASGRRLRLALAALCLAVSLAGHAQVQVDQPASRLDTPLIDGTTLSARELEGKVVLVLFWATWCPTCVKEMPDFQRLHEAYRGRGPVILALPLDVDAEDAADFWKDKGYRFPMATREGALKQAWGPVPATPQIVLTDRKGVVRLKRLGATSYEQLEALIKPLL